ncbi:MAG TPA: SGNH/GDSL hydrolase family protein [Kofleriaceae bacterium]
MLKWLVVAVALAACGDDGSTASDAGGSDARSDAPPGVMEEVHYGGRFDATKQFAWPGSSLTTRFSGTTISIALEDGGENWFEITVDGVNQPPLQAMAGARSYVLASGLADGEHDLVFARRTESFFGTSKFDAFTNATLVPTPRPQRYIEFIGDSITCGYGVLGASATCMFDATTEAETRAWARLTADSLGALHASIAYSGIGMTRNNGGSTDNTMPDRYTRLFADDAESVWGFSYTPDVIVINLSTNDYAMGDPGVAFETTYVAFIKNLRSHFPNVPVLIATSPMLGNEARTTLRAHLDAIAGQLDGVHVMDLAEQMPADGLGCDYHPSTVTDQKMAVVATQAIRDVTGW